MNNPAEVASILYIPETCQKSIFICGDMAEQRVAPNSAKSLSRILEVE
jgi:hypothetical protein